MCPKSLTTAGANTSRALWSAPLSSCRALTGASLSHSAATNAVVLDRKETGFISSWNAPKHLYEIFRHRKHRVADRKFLNNLYAIDLPSNRNCGIGNSTVVDDRKPSTGSVGKVWIRNDFCALGSKLPREISIRRQTDCELVVASLSEQQIANLWLARPRMISRENNNTASLRDPAKHVRIYLGVCLVHFRLTPPMIPNIQVGCQAKTKPRRASIAPCIPVSDRPAGQTVHNRPKTEAAAAIQINEIRNIAEGQFRMTQHVAWRCSFRAESELHRAYKFAHAHSLLRRIDRPGSRAERLLFVIVAGEWAGISAASFRILAEARACFRWSSRLD